MPSAQLLLPTTMVPLYVFLMREQGPMLAVYSAARRAGRGDQQLASQ